MVKLQHVLPNVDPPGGELMWSATERTRDTVQRACQVPPRCRGEFDARLERLEHVVECAMRGFSGHWDHPLMYGDGQRWTQADFGTNYENVKIIPSPGTSCNRTNLSI